MADESSVLVLGAHSAHLATLAERIPQLGYRCIRAKTPQEAVELAHDRGFEFSVALIEPDFPGVELSRALRTLREQTRSPHLVYIATGNAVDYEDQIRLREAGIELAAWLPVSDHALRFQINSAFSKGIEDSLRCDARAPVERNAIVRVAGRTKRVSIYSLSSGGAFLATQRPSMPGASVDISIPTRSGELALTADVLYTNVPGNLAQSRLPIGMAVRFRDPGRDATQTLREMVTRCRAVMNL
jgi:CheY-like chemotaxis protein